MDTQRTNVRELAVSALLMINEEGRHSNTVISDALSKYSHIDLRDRALFVRLVHGSLEYQYQSDYVIGQFSKIKVSKMKPLIREVLRMSVYQLMHMNKIPDNAVCDEAVKLVKKSRYRDLSGFANAVLRNIARRRETVDLSPTDVRYSVPAWMIRLLDESVGREKAEAFLRASLDTHGVSVRTIGTDDIYVIDNAGDLTELDDWKSGRIMAQDYSSAQPVIHAGIKSCDRVLDLCAAPGGKSLQASEKAAEVVACDISEKKTALIKENVERYKADNIHILVRDARVHYGEFDEGFDVVLADLPCSGIGTIAGKPDVKNRLSLEDCLSLAVLQSEILDNAHAYVKTGGRLVYSTCTIDHYENEDTVRAFLQKHTDFALIEEIQLLPDSGPSDIPKDGFYYAVMTRKR